MFHTWIMLHWEWQCLWYMDSSRAHQLPTWVQLSSIVYHQLPQEVTRYYCQLCSFWVFYSCEMEGQSITQTTTLFRRLHSSPKMLWSEVGCLLRTWIYTQKRVKWNPYRFFTSWFCGDRLGTALSFFNMVHVVLYGPSTLLMPVFVMKKFLWLCA